MAEALLSLGVEKLLDLLVRESNRFKEVDEQFNKLKTKLTLLRSFLKDAYAKKHEDEVVRNCVDEIKEIVFDAEDIIETFLRKEELSKTNGIKKHMRRLSFLIVDRRELASQIRGISTRMSEMMTSMQGLGVQKKEVYGEHSHPQEIQMEMRRTYGSNNERDLVGLEDNVKNLVNYLVEEDNNNVVSIIGMGGIGKTTLARQVFNHERIKTHFDGVVWVYISQQFTATKVWRTMLKKLSSKHDENRVSHMTEDDLQEALFELLKTSKSLIILDDMWKEGDWDILKHAFPSKKGDCLGLGWKILLTSRNEKVGIHVDPTCFTFKPECLTIEDSWTLFQRITFPGKDTSEYKVDVKMEEMGKNMIKHCGGLPLAVKVLGGLLAEKQSLSEWKRISENIRSHIVGGTSFNDKNINSVYQILYLSFEELPAPLKHCFLYLAHFPEDYSIDVEKLSYYLEVDGIQKPKSYDGLTIPEVADRYIEELVKRNMVISAKDELTSRFKRCQLHDMMREVCLLKAGEEKFVHVFDPENSMSPCRSRRIAVHRVNDKFHLVGLMKNPKLRSLLFIEDSSHWGSALFSLWLPSALLFTKLQLLRALDLSYMKFEGGKLHSSIGELIHLRYLSLLKAEVSHLPSSMRNLKLLFYLNIDVFSDTPIYMSNTLLNEMRELVYLHLPAGKYVHKKVKMELGNLIKLVTLINFSTEYCSVRDLHRMTRLKTLEIRNYRNDEEGFVLDIYMSRLPDEQRFPSQLTTITLEGCRLEEDPMVILEKLFHLKKVCLVNNVFYGRRMVCSRGGFPQLRKLELYALKELEEWIVEEGSMPLLHSLDIRDCRKLKELPDGMRFISSLKTLEIWEAPLGWKEKLSRGGEDFYKVQHIPLVQFKRLTTVDTLLPFGVQKLWDLLVREADRFKEVDEQFNELKTKLNLLKCFLEDADAKKHTSAVVRICVDEIKEIVFDAEDVIETFLLKQELSKRSGSKKHFRRLDRRKLASEIGGISDRISKVISKMQTGGVQLRVPGGECPHPLQERQREMRRTYASNNESDVVGLEDNVKKLVGYLVEEDSNHVISIIGMGGIGKTTLARQVFNHERIKAHFDGVVWVCISQQFTTKHVWQTILKKLCPKHDENKVSNMTENKLKEELFQLLETSHSLIILDDMWKEEDWDRLKNAFPSKKGWKILLTSRNEKVGLHVDPTCVTLKPECLTIEDSWTLFKWLTIGLSECKVDVEMEEMGKKMSEHCGGLPLAVKVLGGLLAEKYSLSEWERICGNIESHIVGGTNFDERNINLVYHILNLSLEELPTYLKHCFLYLAHLPGDYSVDVKEMFYYLEADGIQRPRYYDQLTIVEVADEYMEELVKRNMVIAVRDDLTSRFEKCQLHDMMREVCLRQAEEEKFVHVVDPANSMSPCRSRRIAVNGVGDTFNAVELMKNPKVRSLLFIKDSSLVLSSTLLFTRLPLLRALDLSRVKFEGGKLHSSIGRLIHLRYLCLFKAEVSHLPSSMRNLKLLLYLNIYVSSKSPIYMSNTLLNEMRELEYLHLPLGEDVHKKVKMEMGNLVKLVTLINFSTEYCSVRDLHRMTRLKTLKIFLGKEDGCSMETLSSSLSEWKHLESLTLFDKKNDDEGFVLDCVHLKQLHLEIYMPKLPDEQRFPSHLTTISLRGCRLEEDPMVILEKLVRLKKVCLWSKSFCGRRMACSRGGFPQLQKLELHALNELEEWIVEEGSMPLLHSLSIRHCPKLRELPDGLRFISSLKTLKIWEAPLGWKEKLSRGGEDFYKVQHIPLIQFD